MSYTAKKQQSSLPLIIAGLVLLGLGYVLGMPAVAQHLPQMMERPLTKYHDEANKAFEGLTRGIRIWS
jgi:hypothetical protein